MKNIAIIVSGPIYLPLDRQISGAYIEEYDPDYNGEGRVKLTRDPVKAIKFDTEQEASDYVHRVNRSRSKLMNGPDRPLLNEFRFRLRKLERRVDPSPQVIARVAQYAKRMNGPPRHRERE
jgi:hypothetical protein